MATTERPKIAPTSFRIENIKLSDFLEALPRVLENEELKDLSLNSLTLYAPRRGKYIQVNTVSIAPNVSVLTAACDDPQLLKLFIEAIEKTFDKVPET